MNAREPEPAELVEDLTYRCLEATSRGVPAIDELLAAQPETVRADVQRRLAMLQRVGLAGAPDSAATPDRFGPFRLLARIGAGSMGVVYRATREGTPGELALKLLQPGLLPLHGARLRFRREIAALRELAHPAICPILDDGEVDGVPWLAMPFVEGESLRDWLVRMAAPHAGSRALLLPIVEQLGRALHHAHERGFVHRDVKPANVIVRKDGDAVLLDFGLARLDAGSEASGHLTVSGAVLGTPAYMAPEQVAGSPLDRRSDVYSLGAVLYEGLTGTVPHTAPTRASLYRRILAGDIQRPSLRAPGLPRDLDVVCLTALDRDPGRRYATALAFAEDLHRVGNGEPPLARLPGPWQRARRWVARHPLPSALLFVLASALLGILLLAGSLRSELRTAKSRALAADARRIVAADPHVALHVALEAYDMAPSREAIAAVQAALAAERTAVELEGHQGRVIVLQFGPDGQHLLSAEEEGYMRWWNLRTQASLPMTHGAPIQAASLAPAGNVAATAGRNDGRLCLFDLDTGRQLWSKPAHAAGKPITVISWSPRTERLLSASADGSARIWDLQGGLVSELPQQAAAITAGAWLDEATVVTGTGRHETEPGQVDAQPSAVCAWRLAPASGAATTRAVEKLDQLDCRASVRQLVVHPSDQELLLVVTRETSARLWRVGTGQGARELAEAAPSSYVVAGGFLDGGERVFTAAWGGRISAYDLHGVRLGFQLRGTFLRSALPMPFAGMILHDAGSGMLTMSNDSGMDVRQFGGERVRVGPLAVAADDSCIACTSWEGRILVWRLFDPDHPVLPLGKCASAAWLADGSVVAGGQEGTGLHASQGKIEVLGRLHTWQPSTGQVLTWGTRDFQIMALFASPDGNTLALSRSSNVRFQLEVLRRSGPGWVAEGAPIELPPESRGFISACFVDGGTRLITSMVQGRILIWDLRTREVVQRIPDEDPASLAGRGDHQDWYAVAATPDARTIWTGGAPGLLHRFDRDPDGSYRETRRPVHARIAALAVLPDGSLLVAGAAGYLVRHFADGREQQFGGHLEVVRSVAWTRLDGEVLIASGDRSGALRIWRLDGTFLREIPAHTDSIWTLGFSPDGTRILSGSGDGTARVWWTREEDLLRVARRDSLSNSQHARFGIGFGGR